MGNKKMIFAGLIAIVIGFILFNTAAVQWKSVVVTTVGIFIMFIGIATFLISTIKYISSKSKDL